MLHACCEQTQYASLLFNSCSLSFHCLNFPLLPFLKKLHEDQVECNPFLKSGKWESSLYFLVIFLGRSMSVDVDHFFLKLYISLWSRTGLFQNCEVLCSLSLFQEVVNLLKSQAWFKELPASFPLHFNIVYCHYQNSLPVILFSICSLVFIYQRRAWVNSSPGILSL